MCPNFCECGAEIFEAHFDRPSAEAGGVPGLKPEACGMQMSCITIRRDDPPKVLLGVYMGPIYTPN